MKLVMATLKKEFAPIYAVCQDDQDDEAVVDDLLEKTGDYSNAIWGVAHLTDETSLLNEHRKFEEFYKSTALVDREG